MDIQDLSQAVITFLAPYLPYLLKAGKEAGKAAAEKLGEKFTEDGWERAKKLWARLHPKVASTPGGKSVIQRAADGPQDQRALDGLHAQIKEALAADPAFAAIIIQLLPGAKVEGFATVAEVAETGEVAGVVAEHIKSGHVYGDAEAMGEVAGRVSGVSAGTIGG